MMLHDVLEDDEHLEALVGGHFGPDLQSTGGPGGTGRNRSLHKGVVVATDRRVIFLNKGIFSTAVTEMPYASIEAISYSTGIIRAELTISGRGTNSLRVTMIQPKWSAKAFADLVRPHLVSYLNPAVPRKADQATQSSIAPSPTLDDPSKLLELSRGDTSGTDDKKGTKPLEVLGGCLVLFIALILIGGVCVVVFSNSDEETTETPPTATPRVAPTQDISATDLSEQLERARSDDARSLEEVHFHSQARAAVVLATEPNSLRVGGGDFRVKRNPVSPGGAFVYDPKTRFDGVERNLVWWVPQGETSQLTAYALNSPSKLVTPRLDFPLDGGVANAPATHNVVAYVFDGIPMPVPTATRTPRPSDSVNNDSTYTVREYSIFRELIDTPMSISEEQALAEIGRRYGISAAEALRIVLHVEEVLLTNGWFGTAESEIRHASDWEG